MSESIEEQLAAKQAELDALQARYDALMIAHDEAVEELMAHARKADAPGSGR